MSSAISCPVIVVPIFAPMMIHTACLSVIMPEFTNPTTITVVADDDWITAVTPAPTRTPRKRLAVSLSRPRSSVSAVSARTHHSYSAKEQRVLQVGQKVCQLHSFSIKLNFPLNFTKCQLIFNIPFYIFTRNRENTHRLYEKLT